MIVKLTDVVLEVPDFPFTQARLVEMLAEGFMDKLEVTLNLKTASITIKQGEAITKSSIT